MMWSPSTLNHLPCHICGLVTVESGSTTGTDSPTSGSCVEQWTAARLLLLVTKNDLKIEDAMAFLDKDRLYVVGPFACNEGTSSLVLKRNRKATGIIHCATLW